MVKTCLCGLCLLLLKVKGDDYLQKQLLKPTIEYKIMGEPQDSQLCQAIRCTKLV